MGGGWWFSISPVRALVILNFLHYRIVMSIFANRGAYQRRETSPRPTPKLFTYDRRGRLLCHGLPGLRNCPRRMVLVPAIVSASVTVPLSHLRCDEDNRPRCCKRPQAFHSEAISQIRRIYFVEKSSPFGLLFSGAGDRDRTGTWVAPHGILSPGRLPVPPHRRGAIFIYR